MDLHPKSKPIDQNKQINSINVSHLTNIALDIWRIRNKLSKLANKIDSESLMPINYSLESCERNLESIGIELKDYTGEVYKSSMNVDVVTYESAIRESKEAIVKETIEPAVLFKNELLYKAKVVVLTPKI